MQIIITKKNNNHYITFQKESDDNFLDEALDKIGVVASVALNAPCEKERQKALGVLLGFQGAFVLSNDYVMEYFAEEVDFIEELLTKIEEVTKEPVVSA